MEAIFTPEVLGGVVGAVVVVAVGFVFKYWKAFKESAANDGKQDYKDLIADVGTKILDEVKKQNEAPKAE